MNKRRQGYSNEKKDAWRVITSMGMYSYLPVEWIPKRHATCVSDVSREVDPSPKRPMMIRSLGGPAPMSKQAGQVHFLITTLVNMLLWKKVDRHSPDRAYFIKIFEIRRKLTLSQEAK